MTAAGWYDDPTDSRALRWWDGGAWTTSTHPRAETVSAPAGWYERPGRPGSLDWWDGAHWVDRDAVEIVDLEQIDLDVVDIRDIPLDRALGSPVVPHVVHHPAGWYADPLSLADWRWWDGETWSPYTRSTAALV